MILQGLFGYFLAERKLDYICLNDKRAQHYVYLFTNNEIWCMLEVFPDTYFLRYTL